MKKIIIALVFSTLFFGCNFGSGPAETETKTSDKIENEIINEAPINDDLFVAISAEILCLPMNHPDAGNEEIESFAKAILEKASVSESSFSNYQKEIETDVKNKEVIALSIVGKMEEFCKLNIENESKEVEEKIDQDEIESDYAKGSLIVGFNANTSETQAREIISQHNLLIKEFHNSVSVWAVVTVPTGEEENWINILEKEANVEYAKQNDITHANDYE